MKDILDTIIVIMFIIMVALFIINFNKQQIKKYTDKLEENEENKTSKKEQIDE
ncbi:hypothetical protein [Aliarcobacter butzleri]|uniref:hypothetical protein n=1 Tax=Aliarcobacter butzleri TaxID=28197 RepID=UPI0024DE018D|nr:hypothetical protein [Aliarcobacter butzleri]MDK2091700.1 hypothetical protein [Aliarcobacter butzleri]